MKTGSVSRGSIRIVYVLGALVLWEMVCTLGWVNPVLLASPTQIIRAAFLFDVRLRDAVLLTATEIVIASFIACVLGLVIGFIVGSRPILTAAFAPILDAANAVPKIMWYPMMVVWFGIGPNSKIVYGVLAGFLPIALVTMDSLKSLDFKLVQAVRSFGANSGQIALRVMLPLALPGIMAGLRIGVTLVAIGIVVAEMLAAFNGLGFWISYNRTTYNAPQIYLGIVLALILTVGLNWGLACIERRTGFWRELERGHSNQAK